MTKELNVWFSESGNYDSYEEGVNDANSFSRIIPCQDELAWIAAIDSVIIGTFGSIWEIRSNAVRTPITSTNPTLKQQCAYGATNIQPVEVDKGLLFVDSDLRKVRELAYDGDGYNAQDMTIVSEHITASGIKEISMQYSPDQILWCVLNNGKVAIMVYERKENTVAWSPVPIDGLVQSVLAIGGELEDDVWIAIQRTIAGEQIYYGSDKVVYGDYDVKNMSYPLYIEKFAPRDFGADIKDAFFVDCGITYEGLPTTTITGLTHLIGEEVAILADGVAQENKTVDNDGQITLDVAASKVQVGLPYTYKLESLKPVVHTHMGTSAASIVSCQRMGISFYNSASVKYGTSDDNLFDIDFSDVRWKNLSTITGLFTGSVEVTVIGGFSLECPLIISGDGPLPCTIRCLVPRMEVSGA